MCGIVGGVAERSITNILVEGLKRLEYRGYDSAGLALINKGHVLRERRVGKVANLRASRRRSRYCRFSRYCTYALGNPW